MKIGSKNPQGTVAYDTWEKIYEHEISASDTEAQLLATFAGADGDTSGTADTGQTITFAGTAQITEGHPMTFNGTAQLDTAQSKFGGSSLLLDGNSDYLSSPDSNDWDFFGSSSDNWTIDFWVKFTDHDGAEYIISQYEDAGNRWNIFHTGGTGWQMTCRSGASNIVTLDGAGEITDTDWHHIAIIKVGSEYGSYVDGTQVEYKNDTSTDTFSGSLIIGSTDGTANFFDGWLDEIRIQNSNPFGAAPNSTPDDTITVPTSAHTADDNTKLLLHLDGADAATASPDSSGLSKIGSTSLWLDGNSDYVSVPDSTDWDVFANTTDSWTVDCWVRHSSLSGSQTYIAQYADNANYWALSSPGAGNVQWYLRGVGVGGGSGFLICEATGVLTVDTWHHIAAVKIEDDHYLYVDGTLVDSYTGFNYTNNISAPLYIGNGNFNFDDYMNGHIDGARVSHEALWTSAFTPPTTVDDYVSTSAITIFGLEGDTDEQYMLDCNFIDSSTVGYYLLKLNGDTGTNYGYQYLQGENTAIGAVRGTLSALRVGNTSTDSYVANAQLLLHAKSGYVRTGLNAETFSVTGTTVTILRCSGYSWNNTADEITSMIISTTADNMGVGSTVSLYRRITA